MRLLMTVLALAGLAPSPVAASPTTLDPTPHGPSSEAFPSHHFQWRAHVPRDFQLGVHFGLVQLELGGLNVSAELRWKRLWLTYQHGMWLTLNHLDAIGLTALGMSPSERSQHLHIYLPYSTGFGVGLLLIDELWLGAELTLSRFEVNAPGGAAQRYTTVSLGAVLGWRFFAWRGLYLGAYLRYWPTLTSSLDRHGVLLTGNQGSALHTPHAFNLYPNLSIGYALDL